MAVLLPLLAWIGMAAGLRMTWPQMDRRHIALRACVLWSAVLVGLTELLSALTLLTPPSLTIGWAIVALGALGWAAWKLKTAPGGFTLPRPYLSRPVRVLWLLVVAVILITGVLAAMAPPQTWDSFNYRMSRVAHWAQQGSVAPFATGIEQQNSRPPMAEMAVLHGYLMTGSDRLANLPAWLAFVGCIVGVSLAAAWLGASKLGQAWAALFVATTPMAIVEASSTMNDIVAAFWALVVAVEALGLWRGGRRLSGWAYLGLGAGLALLTKPIAVPYVAAFGLVALAGTVRRGGVLASLAPIALAAFLGLALNAGHLGRSIATYGSPLEPSQVSVHANQLLGPRTLVSSTLRNVALHLGTPSGYVNKGIALAVEGAHRLMGMSPSDPRITAHTDFEIKRPTKIETRVANPFQMLFMLGAAILLFVRRRAVDPAVLLLGLAAIAGFLLYSLLFKWQLFGSRYHLPFFILMAPVVSALLDGWASDRILLISGMALAVACLPWLLSLDDRPIVATPSSDSPSVFKARRDDLYFANARQLADPFRNVRDRILEAECDRVGLALSGNSAEYLLWALLGAPRNDLRIEWLVSGTPSAAFQDVDFQPCAVVCEGCPEAWTEVRGLPLAWRQGSVRLFLAPEEEPWCFRCGIPRPDPSEDDNGE